jgi:hypothetical protein
MDQADPLETREIVRESDVNFQNMRTLFHIWFETFKTQKVTVRDISEAAEHNQELYDALFAVAGRKGKFDQPYLGYWLRKHRNKIMDEIQLIEAGRNRTNTTQWQMVSLNSQGPVRENVLKLQDVKSNPESTGKVKNDIETI